MKKDNKVVQYPKPINMNVGVVIFVIIFIYLLFNVFSYLTESHISVYEVEQGTIAVNNVYKGLILRDEQIYTTDYNGSVNYYVKETTKVAYNDLICSVDESGNVANMIQEASQNVSKLDSESLAEIEERIFEFQNTYQSQDFYNVYSFKTDINAVLSEALSMSALNSISDYVTTAENNQTFHKINAAESGIVVYYTDGFESVTLDNFTSDMFDESVYNKLNLKNNSEVTISSPIYKMINSELWNIVIKIDAETAAELADKSAIKIRFLKDAKEMYANCSILNKGNQDYLVLSLKNSMVRYALDRYIEIELLYSEESGLKIPNSAITEKEFYTIPCEYFLKGGDSDKNGLLVSRIDENGKRITEFINPTIYFETETHCYIDSEDVSAGDILIKENSTSEYVVGTDTAPLKGVYNINKGYAVFKQIDILYQNEEYSIIKTGTTYGVSLYDHIALDSTKVNENELIK